MNVLDLGGCWDENEMRLSCVISGYVSVKEIYMFDAVHVEATGR